MTYILCHNYRPPKINGLKEIFVQMEELHYYAMSPDRESVNNMHDIDYRDIVVNP